MVGRIIRASIATYIVLPDNRRLTDFQIMPERGACNTVKAILTQLSMSTQLVFALSYLRDTCPIELEFDLISFELGQVLIPARSFASVLDLIVTFVPACRVGSGRLVHGCLRAQAG
jgi:hypothetical protein